MTVTRSVTGLFIRLNGSLTVTVWDSFVQVYFLKATFFQDRVIDVEVCRGSQSMSRDCWKCVTFRRLVSAVSW